MTNGAQVNAQTFYGRNGNAGSVTIVARESVVVEGQTNEVFSGVFSNVLAGAKGNAGNIRIDTGSLSLAHGTQLNASIAGEGNAGSVAIIARNTVRVDGETKNQQPSAVVSSLDSGGLGKAGDITIETGSLFLTNGGLLNASTFGQGNGGSVTILARDTVSLDGEASNRTPSGVLSLVGSQAVGKGGEVNITTRSLFLTKGATVNVDTSGNGNAGSVNINAHDTVSFDGEKSDGASSGVFSTVSSQKASGKGGEVNITTGTLSLTNGAVVNVNTSGKGDAGNVNIDARDTVSFDQRAAAISGVNNKGVGNGGSINITTGSLSLTNGAQLRLDTQGEGNAGSVNIDARDTVSFGGGENSDIPGEPGGVYNTVRGVAMGEGGTSMSQLALSV